MKLYQVQGTITRTDDGAHSTRQIPTFYLDSNVQGIMSLDHARRVAGDVVSTIAGPVHLGHAWSYELAVTVVEAARPAIGERRKWTQEAGERRALRGPFVLMRTVSTEREELYALYYEATQTHSTASVQDIEELSTLVAPASAGRDAARQWLATHAAGHITDGELAISLAKLFGIDARRQLGELPGNPAAWPL